MNIQMLKNKKGITMVSLIITIIILIILVGIGIATLGNKNLLKNSKVAKQKYDDSEKLENSVLNQYENDILKYTKNISTRNDSDSNDNVSKDIEDFTPVIKETNGTYLYVTTEKIKVNNGNKIGAYIWILNGKVVGGTTENEFIYDNLNYNNKYNLQVAAIDENGKFKISKEVSADTIDKTYIYLRGKVFEKITGGISHINRTSYGGCSVTFNSNNIYIDAYSNGGGGGVTTNKAIDLTKFSKVKAKGEMTEYVYHDSSEGRILSISTSNLWGSSWYPANSKAYIRSGIEKGEIILENDISSLTGEYYIMNGFNQSRGYVYEIWLEK